MSDEIIIIRDPVTNIVIEQIEQDIEVAQPGPQGPQGIQGPPGSAGGARHSHIQDSPSTIWPVNHNLGYYPHVTVLSDIGVDITDGVLVEHSDVNNLSIHSGLAISGRAEIS